MEKLSMIKLSFIISVKSEREGIRVACGFALEVTWLHWGDGIWTMIGSYLIIKVTNSTKYSFALLLCFYLYHL